MSRFRCNRADRSEVNECTAVNDMFRREGWDRRIAASLSDGDKILAFYLRADQCTALANMLNDMEEEGR